MALRQSEIISLAGQYDVPAELALAIYQQESGGGKYVGTSETNIGGFQVAPSTFDEVYPGGDINNERDNAIAGIRYLKQGLAATGGDIAQTAMYYHAGPKFAEKLAKNPDLQDVLGKRTTSYATDIMNRATAFRQKLVESGQIDEEGTRHVTLPPSKTSQVSERSLPTVSTPLSNKEVIENMTRELTGKVADTQQQLNEYNTYNSDLRIQYRANVEDVVNAITGEYGAKKAELLANASSKAQLSAEAAKRLTDLGINSSDVNNLAAQLSVRMRDSKQKADVIRSEIQAKEGETSFLADPITWVQNQIAINDSIRVHNNLIGNFNADKDKITQLTSVADQLTTSNLAKKGVLDMAAAVAGADALSAEGQRKAAEVRAQGMTVDHTLAAQQLQATDAKLRLYESTIRVLQLSENADDKATAKQLQADADALMLKQYNDAGAQLGYAPFNSMKEIQMLPNQQKVALAKLKESGGTRYGASFQEAWENVNSGNINKLPVGNKTMLPYAAIAKQAGTDAISAEVKAGIKHTKQEDFDKREQVARDTFNSWQQNTAKDPIDGVPGNLYRAGSAASMVKEPVIMKTKLGELLKTHIEQNPDHPVDDKFVVKLAVQAFLNGDYKKPEEAAKDVATYFTRAKEINNSTVNFRGWGVPEQTVYGFAASDGGLLYDFSSYKEALKYFVKDIGGFFKLHPNFQVYG